MANATLVPIFDGSRPVSTFISAIDILPLDDAEKLRLCMRRLSPAVKGCIDSIQRHMREGRQMYVAWTWHLVKLALYGIEEQLSDGGSFNGDIAVKAATAIGTAAVAWLIVPPAARMLIGLAGFSAGGVVAGSVAAGIQSSVYRAGVPAGSVFAACQSTAARAAGAAANTANIVVGVAARAAAAIGERNGRVSRTWKDGVNFHPSQKLLDTLINAENLHS